MNSEEGSTVAIDGEPVDEAVETVVAADASRDPDRVRTALDHVTEDGVVRAGAVEPALGHLSKVVSTPETRVELAEIALEDARETADSVSDLDTVAARLDGFEDRVETIAQQVGGLGEDLQALIESYDDPTDLYATAVGIQRLTERANALQAAADDVQLELERFESWVETESARLTDLGEDVAAAEGELDELEAAITELESGIESVEDPAAVDGLAVSWVQTSVGRRVTEVLVADLRAELSDLRAWPGGVEDEQRLGDLDDDLDALETRLDAVARRLDDLAEPEWRERFGDQLDDLDAALDGFEPPVDWGALQATVEETHPIARAE
jgi:predicted  nucleic acid-binding Zn-ribbon protein